MATESKTPSIAPSAVTLSPKVSKARPRFFVLMILFLGVSTITVALLGWQLTLNSAKDNIRGLIAEMEDLVSHQIFGIIQDAAESLQELTHLQATYFRQNKWSQVTPTRANETLRNMLTILDRNRKQTSDIYYYTYPEGRMHAYVYPNDDLTIPPQIILQDSNLNMNFYRVDALGNVIGDMIFTFPGYNITKALLPGGAFKSNIDYSNKTWKGFTGIFVGSGQLVKSSIQIAVNPVTGEQVTVGNDWTMELVSSRLKEITGSIPYPTFAAFLDLAGGNLVATSDSVVLNNFTDIYPLSTINNTFARDLSTYLASHYPASTAKGQLDILVKQFDRPSSAPQIYVNRIIDGTRWMLELKVMNLLGERFVFAVYMNVDFVERDIIASGERTGYMMMGIIIAFLAMGTLFSWAVASQLSLVSRQIALLKLLKFQEVLDRESGVKGRSFIYELAGLQEAFYEMAQTFANTIKTSISLKGNNTSYAPNSSQRP
ncbi:hypothetical protein BDR26DRAFT_865483 [Obelidium mucronatum]|nr:hypothetical protein BDR26DRAFT_865483 [Obelidium mucronatum]